MRFECKEVRLRIGWSDVLSWQLGRFIPGQNGRVESPEIIAFAVRNLSCGFDVPKVRELQSMLCCVTIDVHCALSLSARYLEKGLNSARGKECMSFDGASPHLCAKADAIQA